MTEMNHATSGDVPQQPTIESDAGFEVPRYHIPEVVALDFDRTLADNGACMERLYKAAEDLPGFSLEQMKAEQKKVEQKKDTFDPLHHIRELLLTAGDNIAAD